MPKISALLTEEELARERNLFAPTNKEYKALGGARLDLHSFMEPPKKTDICAGKSGKDDEPAVFVPPSC